MTATCHPCLFLRCIEFAGFTIVEKRIPRGLCSNKYTMRICGLQCFTTHLYDMIKYLAIMCPMPLCGDNLVIKRWRTWLAGCNRPRHFSAKQLCEPNFPSRPFPFTPTLSPFCTHPSLSHYIFTMLFIINEDFIICAEYNSQRTQLKVYEGTNLNNRLGQKKNVSNERLQFHASSITASGAICEMTTRNRSYIEAVTTADIPLHHRVPQISTRFGAIQELRLIWVKI